MPVDEHKLLRDQGRGAGAQSLLENDLLKEAYEKLEAELIAGWINSAPRDADGRERVWHAVQANRKHKAYLEQILSDGKMAAAELRALAETPQPKRWEDVR